MATFSRGDRVRITAPHHLESCHGEVQYRLGTQVGGPAPMVRLLLDAGYHLSVPESMVEPENGSSSEQGSGR